MDRIGRCSCDILLNLGKSSSFRVQIPRRYRHKSKWASARKTKAPTQIALEAFDSMYGAGLLQDCWPSVRLGLLSTQKYAAVINTFSGRRDQIQHELKQLGAFPLTTFLSGALDHGQSKLKGPSDHSDHSTNAEGADGSTEESEFIPARRVEETESPEPVRSPTSRIDRDRLAVIDDGYVPGVPKYLQVYLFPRGDLSTFPQPKVDASGLLDYYLMDAASLLTVIAMDLKYDCSVLDICSAPGGKSVTMLQTLLPGSLHCNDLSASRINRLNRVLRGFFPMDDYEFSDKLTVTNVDACFFRQEEKFDNALVDVPCTTDQLSCTENENNIFTSRRTGERNALPELQMEILMTACRAVKPGGSVVYATCTLSPLQNDGVVHMAAKNLKEEGIEMVVVNTSPIRQMFREVFRFHDSSDSYGQTVLPFLPNNFGPSYFCKLKRIDLGE